MVYSVCNPNMQESFQVGAWVEPWGASERRDDLGIS